MYIGGQMNDLIALTELGNLITFKETFGFDLVAICFIIRQTLRGFTNVKQFWPIQLTFNYQYIQLPSDINYYLIYSKKQQISLDEQVIEIEGLYLFRIHQQTQYFASAKIDLSFELQLINQAGVSQPPSEFLQADQVAQHIYHLLIAHHYLQTILTQKAVEGLCTVIVSSVLVVILRFAKQFDQMSKVKAIPLARLNPSRNDVKTFLQVVCIAVARIFENLIFVGHPALSDDKFWAIFVDRDVFDVAMLYDSLFYLFGFAKALLSRHEQVMQLQINQDARMQKIISYFDELSCKISNYYIGRCSQNIAIKQNAFD